MKSSVGLGGSKVLKGSGLKCSSPGAERDTDRVTARGQTPSASFIRFQKWVPRKCNSCLCRACPSLPQLASEDRGEVSSEAGRRHVGSKRFPKVSWTHGWRHLADIPVGALPGHFAISRDSYFPVLFQFSRKMNGVRTEELRGSLQH